MNTKVLSIKLTEDPNCHEVLLLIGEKQHIFRFTTKVNQVGDRQLQTTQAEQRFSDFFKFNQRVAMNVSQLVVKFHNQEVVELPVNVGDFVTPKEAIWNLKPFKDEGKQKIGNGSKEYLIDNGQTEEMNQDVRQKAMG